MLNCLIRNFTILSIAIYTFYKLLNKTPTNPIIQALLIIFSFTISMISSYVFTFNQTFNWICILIFMVLLMKCFCKNTFAITYTTTLFSFSLSFLSFIVSGIIVSTMLYPWYLYKYNFSWFFIRILVGLLDFILIQYCFKIPRLQKGMIFLYSLPQKNIGSTICLFIFTDLLMLSQTNTYTRNILYPFIALILFLGFLLLYWWNYHITQTYKKFLRKNEIDSLTLLLEEKEQEIEYLKSENEKLARIIHKDNKLIPALISGILSSASEQHINDKKCENNTALSEHLQQLHQERENILNAYQQEMLTLPETAFPSVNAVLSYMQTQALKNNIPYQVLLNDDLTSTIPNKISEEDFIHLLSDLLSNAIHACENISMSNIQIYLGKMDLIPGIKIQNHGTVFPLEILQDFGLIQHTTRADCGGSGIGLLDIWKIKSHYKATLLIEETTLQTPCTCITLLFDHKNHYLIQSDRSKELSLTMKRSDLIILTK